MGEIKLKREKDKQEIVKRKGWYVPSIHGKFIDKMPGKDDQEGV